MKALLSALADGHVIQIGETASIAKYTDLPAIFVRMEGSGLISPDFRFSHTGMKQALAWLDTACCY